MRCVNLGYSIVLITKHPKYLYAGFLAQNMNFRKTEVISLCIRSLNGVFHDCVCSKKVFTGLCQIHTELKLVLKDGHCFTGVLINIFMADIPNGSSREAFVRNEFWELS